MWNKFFFIDGKQIIQEYQYDLNDFYNSVLLYKLNCFIKNYKSKKRINLKISMILTDDEPICQRSGRLSILEILEVQKEIDHWLKEGII